MLRFNWEGSDWPKAVTPLSKLEVLYGLRGQAGSGYGFHYRINERPGEGYYDSADEAKQAAEDKYFAIIDAEWHSYHYGKETEQWKVT